ncbi:MAG: DEAD/DEAH box helicase [Candidatus Woesearchaeota archaeon]
MTTFADLGLKKDIVASVSFKEPSDVQKAVIPLALQKKNIFFTSRTGSGKTLAYLLGYLSRINTKLGIQMLVLVPTRELAIQVGKEMMKICDRLKINVGVLFGGREMSGDYRTVSKKLHILVGTPGRITDHINAKTIKLGEVGLLVFDESDQMFDQGFFDACVYIRSRVSKDVQLFLSSATMTKKVNEFIYAQLGAHESLHIGDMIPKNIVQEKMFCKKEDKNDALFRFFSSRKFSSAMVFCNTKLKCTAVSDFLAAKGFKAKPLSSDLEQKAREATLSLFRAKQIKILVTTDVAARGLHIEKVGLIVNYDVPNRDEFYVHRIGRTGRVDNAGYALTLICPEDVDRFSRIEADYALDISKKDF